MPSSVGLEVMKSTNPELSWKLVKKGRRSKKSVARSLNSVVKVGNSTSPKRVGDFSGSDSDKFGEVIIKQATSGKSKNVPLKKRRHLLQSPSAPWASSLSNQDSNPLRTHSSSPLLEGGLQLHYPSYSSGQRPSNLHLKGIGKSAKAGCINCGFGGVSPCNQVESEYDCAGDFSGIELLATAATSMVDGVYGADLKDVLPDDSSIQKNSDASSSAIMPEQGLKNSESVHSLSNNDVRGGIMDSQDKNSAGVSQSISTSPEDDTIPKVSRRHWDLNTPMDAWGEQYDDSIAEDTLGDASVGMHMEEMEKHYGDHLLSNPSSLKDEEDKSTLVPEDGICSEPPQIVVNLQEPPNNIFSHIGCDTFSLSREKDTDEKNSIQALNCDSHMKFLNQVTRPDINVGISPFSKLCCTCGNQMSEGKNNGISGSATMRKDGDCSSNISECERTAAQDGTRTGTDVIKSCVMAASEFTTDVQLKDTEVSLKTCHLLGTFTLDAQPVASTDSNKGMHGAFHSSSLMADCKQYFGLAEPDTKHDEGCNLPEEGSKRTMMEDTCKSFIAGTQCDKPTTVGRMRFAVDGREDPNVSHGNHGHGDDLTGFQEGYDSSYEDGELRGSLLYSLEDNELENECVDYESDGRNGDGCDAADYYMGSEIVQGGSEGTHGTHRSLSLKISAEGKNKSGPAKYPSKKHDVKDKSDNNEMAGKVSNAGSGSTVEQCMEMATEENAAAYGLQLVDHKDAVNVAYIDEYASKAIKGKLQSRSEGRSSADPSDGKGVFFVQQSRPRRIAGAYPRAEREISPDRYLGRYKSAAASGEGDRVHQWTSWFPKRRHTINYQGGEGRSFTRPRNKTGESINKIDGVDYHEPRQTNYLSKGLHRPFIRRSPAERDDYFGVGRREPLTRGVGNYRSAGHYSQRPGRDFGEDFKPLPEDAGAPVRVPRYLPKRDRSFSPSNNGRQTHMNLPRRRSHSRSRMRSPPRAWHSHREQRTFGGRRLSRSPDFRSEARMERTRLSFSKSTFASDYGEGGYISPSRGRFSPQRNCRWVDDRNFADNNHTRRRRSPPPARVFRRDQRFDGVGPSGRLKSNDYFRPLMQRPGRFTYMANGGRECKLESNYDDRSFDDNGDAGNTRRFLHNDTAGAGDDSEAKNMDDEEKEIRVEVPHNQGGEMEDKKAFKI